MGKIFNRTSLSDSLKDSPGVVEPLPLQWLYYKLTLGDCSWAFDDLISLLSDIVEDKRIRKWFYIRYFDEDGPHLRLRLGVGAEMSAALDAELYPRLYNLTTHISALPTREVHSLVKIDLPDIATEAFALGVKRAKYEPETSIYIGDEGVRIAEEVFQISSEIALFLIAREREGHSCRKDVAPALFWSALEAFPTEKGPGAFLTEYVDYWVGGYPLNAAYLGAFERKFFDLSGEGTSVVRPDEDYGGDLFSLLAKWRKSLRQARMRYGMLERVSPAELRRVLFYFIHLMNNRLGYSILDEIYLAVLIKNWLACRTLNEPVELGA